MKLSSVIKSIHENFENKDVRGYLKNEFEHYSSRIQKGKLKTNPMVVYDKTSMNYYAINSKKAFKRKYVEAEFLEKNSQSWNGIVRINYNNIAFYTGYNWRVIDMNNNIII